MTLHVFTARLGYPGPDALDLTRRRAREDARAGRVSLAEPFAPPEWLLAAAKGYSTRLPPGVDPIPADTDARWAWYERHYLAAMRVSYRAHRAAWDEILRRESVTGLCFCSTASACHRGLWAAILVKLGAVYVRERTAAEHRGEPLRPTTPAQGALP